jgi:hypothetical protein
LQRSHHAINIISPRMYGALAAEVFSYRHTCLDEGVVPAAACQQQPSPAQWLQTALQQTPTAAHQQRCTPMAGGPAGIGHLQGKVTYKNCYMSQRDHTQGLRHYYFKHPEGCGVWLLDSYQAM